jgi:hypothetical protein
MYESSGAAATATWGPSLILLLAVLLATWLILRISTRGFTGDKSIGANFVGPTSRNSGELGIALEAASSLNKYNVHAGNNPSVHLGTALRFVPLDYQNSVREILQGFREGRVLTIDLSKMDKHQAARLVDFCSGMAAAGSGWIYCVTESVIVLTPYT